MNFWQSVSAASLPALGVLVVGYVFSRRTARWERRRDDQRDLWLVYLTTVEKAMIVLRSAVGQHIFHLRKSTVG